MTYKGYFAKMEVDEDEGVIYGRVIGLSKDGITFSGRTVEEAIEDFHGAVDDYLSWAAEEGFEPEKGYGGKFIVRATAEQHKKIACASAATSTSMNTFVLEAAIEKADRVLPCLDPAEA